MSQLSSKGAARETPNKYRGAGERSHCHIVWRETLITRVTTMKRVRIAWSRNHWNHWTRKIPQRIAAKHSDGTTRCWWRIQGLRQGMVQNLPLTWTDLRAAVRWLRPPVEHLNASFIRRELFRTLKRHSPFRSSSGGFLSSAAVQHGERF